MWPVLRPLAQEEEMQMDYQWALPIGIDGMRHESYGK